MGKVIHKEIDGELQTIIEFESYEDFNNWCSVGCSRIILEGNTNKLDIDWSDIDPKYKWAAMDSSGTVYVYSEEPFINDVWDLWDNNSSHKAIRLLNTPQKEFWKETLTKRPEDKQNGKY